MISIDDIQNNFIYYNTDKLSKRVVYSHNFIYYYDFLFSDIRYQVKNIAEIGVLNGGSCRLWLDYFPNSKISMIDKHESNSGNLIESDRIVFYKCDQSKIEDIKSLKPKLQKQDIILDDGSHRNKDQQITFSELFSSVKKDGYYIIEDTHTSILPKYNAYFEPEEVEEKYSTEFLFKDIEISKLHFNGKIQESIQHPLINSNENIISNHYISDETKEFLIKNVTKIYKIFLSQNSHSIIIKK